MIPPPLSTPLHPSPHLPKRANTAQLFTYSYIANLCSRLNNLQLPEYGTLKNIQLHIRIYEHFP